MNIGVPTEIKNSEYRVGLVPASVHEAVHHGHTVLVQSGAGAGIGFSDDDYRKAGAVIVPEAETVFAEADMIVKVKEPQAVERCMLRPGQILFTYLHLAPDPDQTRELVESGAVCIAYETVTAEDGSLPLLAPMSEVAGRLSIQAGAWALEKTHGGRGMLLGGVAGVQSARVVILGGGVVGRNAAAMAVGLGADVVVLDRDIRVLRWFDSHYGNRVQTLHSNRQILEQQVMEADLVIGGVLVPGARTPHLIGADTVGRMRPGSVLVDVSIDQGGCFETSHPTTHADPVFTVGDVVHYCVANMPGAVPRTSTFALNNATLPYILQLADLGWREALLRDPHLRNGLNVAFGKVSHQPVARDLGYDYTPAETVLETAA